DYLNEAVLLYLRDESSEAPPLVDWQQYFAFKKESDDAAGECETLRAILATAGEICESIEGDARESWDACAELVDGEVIHPP
ncbi:MAG: hypothetical protein GWN09_04000, partial [Gammaproteobacteria bacterium]|nr:hypothetical protein [Gammaproteobacteria bacterium]